LAKVDFHSQVGDKLSYTCRLARKIFSVAPALQPIKHVVIVGPDMMLKALDLQLWTFSAEEFIPHAWCDEECAVFTPFLLASEFDEKIFSHLPHQDVLINLGQTFLTPIEVITKRFDRIIEVVSLEEQDLLAGRERYKRYRTMDVELTNYDQKGAS